MISRVLRKKAKRWVSIGVIFLGMSQGALATLPEKHVILFVWDGLRADAVSAARTPNLFALMKKGTQFSDNHSTFPTFTLINAASFATGNFPGKTSFFGNTEWHPSVSGFDSAGAPINFEQPVFAEDYRVLQALDQDTLFFVPTLFQTAHHAGFTTATVGKTGAAFMQDYKGEGIIFDEKHAFPLSFALQVQKDGYPLPKYSTVPFPQNSLTLAPDNGDPTAAGSIDYVGDGVTPDPSSKSGSPYAQANQYMMTIYLNEILPKKPVLSVVWMRDPDTTEHEYGPGTYNYLAALANNDKMLGELEDKLKGLGLAHSTDVIIVSDHGHSHVSGPLNEFPLRAVCRDCVGKKDARGFSVSGEVRTADLLTQAGFHAYDGEGCRYDPILSGVRADGTSLYPKKIDANGSVCGKAGQAYTTPAYRVPDKSKLTADTIIIAAKGNGGSEYFYVPSHDKKVVEQLVQFLQSHEQFGPLFVDDRYAVDGAIPMSMVYLRNNQGRSPDVVASLNFNEKVIVNGLPGIEFSDNPNLRGMHGSFSPVDVHNFLFAMGPDFRAHFRDTLPTGNVDVAPTIAYVLKLNLPTAYGRVLREALLGGTANGMMLKRVVITAKTTAKHLKIFNAINQKTPATTYTENVATKRLTTQTGTYTYFDRATVIRK